MPLPYHSITQPTAVASTFLFQYIGGREAREREVFSSASEMHEWHSKESKVAYAHGNFIKGNRKKNSRIPTQTLKIFQNSEFYLNLFWTLKDRHISLTALLTWHLGDSQLRIPGVYTWCYSTTNLYHYICCEAKRAWTCFKIFSWGFSGI